MIFNSRSIDITKIHVDDKIKLADSQKRSLIPWKNINNKNVNSFKFNKIN